MLPGSREVQASGPVKEDTVIGPKIAAVERREARVPVKRRAAPQGAATRQTRGKPMPVAGETVHVSPRAPRCSAARRPSDDHGAA